MDENEDLDISWIEEHEKLQSVDKNYFREPMETITVTIVYINANSYIENITSEKQPLTQNSKTAVLEKERLLQIIQSKKKTTAHSRYKFMDALLYNVDLEPEHIQKYANSPVEENQALFLKRLPIVDDISISPSIFIFHGINGLYLLFKEEPRTDIQNIKTKSILKLDGDNNIPKKLTKRVKIVLKPQNHSTTKKRIKNEATDNNKE
jgi:hypothetical protein